VYWFDTNAPSVCWSRVGSLGGVLSIAADNYSSSAYSVWATDGNNKLYAACVGTSCTL
jgi:hypothetical protein